MGLAATEILEDLPLLYPQQNIFNATGDNVREAAARLQFDEVKGFVCFSCGTEKKPHDIATCPMRQLNKNGNLILAEHICCYCHARDRRNPHW